MRERVGSCSVCHREIYCENGFLNGVVIENAEICCFDCYQEIDKKEQEE